jgi:Protein of unknown function (DUF2934)
MNKTVPNLPEDRVAAVAYSLWLEEGQPQGRAEAHWFQALELVNAEAGAGEAPTAKPKRKAPTAAAAKKAAPSKRG